MIKTIIGLNGANKGGIAGSCCDAKHFPDLFLMYTPISLRGKNEICQAEIPQGIQRNGLQ